MAHTADRSFLHLPLAAARLAGVAGRPRAIAMACIALLSGAGWLYLGALAGLSSPAGPFDWLSALCRPSAVAPDNASAQFMLVFAMWSAMALAMMLPSAAPMILTYAEIADTASAKGEPVVSPVVLAGGYAAVWIAVSFAVAAVQTALQRAGLAGIAGTTVPGYGAAALFVAAGLYQFSPVKHACLRVCQRPFPFFFANWRTTVSGVFALGLRQGGHCLGCCWAMMLLMFATGLMNAVWMAALGIVMAVEKLTATPRFSHAVGAVLIAAGLVLAVLHGTGLGAGFAAGIGIGAG
ncbi:MAG: DUF2182 domain-containing protein [Pseudorhodoplanes sp.]|nr:DUF2182 domain-containing protein [Pseudorhodoplanes sp.]